MTNEGSRLRGAEPSKSELKEAPINPVFRHARKMGLEGIVSKRLGSRYRSGRTSDWLKFKNPEAPAVKREAEEKGAVKNRTHFNSPRGYVGG
ncbi:MAG: hypothetical protein WB686_11490 [Pseudolabrys sp.]